LAVGSAAANCQLPTANFFISFRASPCDLAAPSAYKETMKWMLHDDSIVTDAFVEEAYTAQLKRRDGFTIERFIESVLRGEDRLDNKVKQIKAPTLIIWGRQDEVTPLNIGAAFAKEIPNAQTAFIDRCGHMPQWECPTPLNRALLDFLAGGSTAAAK
jgi:2-hydroxy-6-oxonona-2,4-dienedioate hydrolase